MFKHESAILRDVFESFFFSLFEIIMQIENMHKIWKIETPQELPVNVL